MSNQALQNATFFSLQASPACSSFRSSSWNIRRAWWLALITVALSPVGLADLISTQKPNSPTPNATASTFVEINTAHFHLALDPQSQTIRKLQPNLSAACCEQDQASNSTDHTSHTHANQSPYGPFDFAPYDRLDKRQGDGFYHLGDITLRIRQISQSGQNDQQDPTWQTLNTAEKRQPVQAFPQDRLPVGTLAAADLTPTLPDNPLHITRHWMKQDDHLALRFVIENTSNAPVEIGSLSIPMVFNNIITDRSLDEAHTVCSFVDPYIGQDAGYVQVTRLSGKGPALVVMPDDTLDTPTPFEAYRPVREPMWPNQTFEGMLAWQVHTKAYAENEWQHVTPWNQPTAHILEPGQSRTYGLTFALSPSIREIEQTIEHNNRPVAVGIPGYILPQNEQGKLFLRYDQPVKHITATPADSIAITAEPNTTANQHNWQTYTLEGQTWGRSRITVTYEDGLTQTIHCKVIKSAQDAVNDLGRFSFNEQWYENDHDPFGRSPSIMSYDRGKNQQILQEPRVWIAGLSDEGGAGAWLAATMKQLVQHDLEEVHKLERFADEVVFGNLQIKEGDQAYGVKKTLFYYEPDELPEGYYDANINWGNWTSWNKKSAGDLGRTYNYPHVAALHWVLYRLARYHEGLVTQHSWEYHLNNAYETGLALQKFAPHYAQFGLMEGTVFLRILQDVQREGWDEKAQTYEQAMRKRAEHWKQLAYPFGSEMAWDSTGQEEVFAWCHYFAHKLGLETQQGQTYAAKAGVSLDAILGYMPTVPHWGYNGNARRYWDFWYGGKLSRIERQLHHYGSALNAVPLLTQYRQDPDDFYLLRVGYGGMMGALSNIDQEGFASAAFHSYPDTLKWDDYTGDYGPSFFGHAINTGTYIVRHKEFGWLAFGGNTTTTASGLVITPTDSMQQRVYLYDPTNPAQPIALYLTLDAGTFESITIQGQTITATLAQATDSTTQAVLTATTPTNGVSTTAVPYQSSLAEGDTSDLYRFNVPLKTDGPTTVTFTPAPSQ